MANNTKPIIINETSIKKDFSQNIPIQLVSSMGNTPIITVKRQPWPLLRFQADTKLALLSIAIAGSIIDILEKI